MKIVVLVKEVPDTYGDRKLDLETGLADREASERVLDEIGERAAELAITLAEKNVGSEVVVLTAGQSTVSASQRKVLAMGATSAIHVLDAAMLGADLALTAEVLATAIRRVGFDLVITGNASTDGGGGVLAAMIAEHLGVAHVSNLNSVEIDGDEVRGARASDLGTMQVSTSLPTVVSITERLPDSRLPGFKGIMAAKKKPVETLSLVDLGVDAEPSVPRSIMVSIAERPPRQAGVKIIDEGNAGEQIADFLIQNGLV